MMSVWNEALIWQISQTVEKVDFEIHRQRRTCADAGDTYRAKKYVRVAVRHENALFCDGGESKGEVQEMRRSRWIRTSLLQRVEFLDTLTYLTDKYFDEQLERIREIRASERKFYQKITDIYATAIDYDKTSATTKRFYATVQNKMHFAVHGHTAAELIVERADHQKEHMGLTTWADAPDAAFKFTFRFRKLYDCIT